MTWFLLNCLYIYVNFIWEYFQCENQYNMTTLHSSQADKASMWQKDKSGFPRLSWSLYGVLSLLVFEILFSLLYPSPWGYRNPHRRRGGKKGEVSKHPSAQLIVLCLDLLWQPEGRHGAPQTSLHLPKCLYPPPSISSSSSSSPLPLSVSVTKASLFPPLFGRFPLRCRKARWQIEKKGNSEGEGDFFALPTYRYLSLYFRAEVVEMMWLSISHLSYIILGQTWNRGQ